MYVCMYLCICSPSSLSELYSTVMYIIKYKEANIINREKKPQFIHLSIVQSARLFNIKKSIQKYFRPCTQK